MEFWLLILLLGACNSHWTTATVFERGSYFVNTDNGTLKSVTAINASSELDLSNLEIKKIERKVFDNLTHLKRLNLANNSLETLPQLIFSKLKNLEELSLANNKISTFNRNFVGLNNLKFLNIANNLLIYLTRGDFFGLNKLTNIIVAGNKLSAVTSTVFQKLSSIDPQSHDLEAMPFLRSEYFKDNETFKAIPVLKNFKVKIYKTEDGLVEYVEGVSHDNTHYGYPRVPINRGKKKLNLGHLNLKKFQSGWYHLSVDFITGLDLSRNDITEITAELFNNLPSNLDSINLGNNKINVIKKDIIDNRYLKKLYLTNNFVSIIEDGAFEKTELTSISLENNDLNSLAFTRTLPTTINRLNLQNNKISEIPENSLRHLKNLKYLKLSDNNITVLPLHVFKGLRQLYALDLSSNYLEYIESGTFAHQMNLVHLSLARNRISELDPGMFIGLKMLESIRLNTNKIQKISRDSFVHLKNGSGLYFGLWENKIDTIEEGSFAHMSINEIQLSSNQITEDSIAKGAFNSTIVRELYLEDNKMTRINGDSFYGTLEINLLHLGWNKIRNIKKGDAKYMGNVARLSLAANPVTFLENGALYGIQTGKCTQLLVYGVPLKVIQGGIFDDL